MPHSPLRTAVFCHDTWHPAATVRRGLAPLAHGEFVFDFLDTPAAWQSTSLATCDLAVLAKGNTTGPDDRSPWLTPEIADAFLLHVRSGKGLLIIHGGTCYRENATLRALTGGAFQQHPLPCTVALELRADHPITHGVSAATFHDEHYHMVLDDPQADVFLHTRSPHGLQPAGWTRQENGRVCVLTPGHTDDAWANAQFQKLLANSLHWIAGKLS